jgi:TonB family protein
MAPGPYRVGNGIEPPRKIKDVRPIYPAGALSSRALGTVLIEAIVGADGKVHDATIVHSIPTLDQAALDAVRQWEFVPSRLNGVAVAVVITVLVQFSIY